MSGRIPRRRLIELVVLLTAATALFSLVGRWGPDANPDAAAVAIPAWTLTRTGSLNIEDVPGPKPWTVEIDGAEYSERPPGLIALVVPAYAVASTDEFTNSPATVVALLLTVAALGVTWYVIERYVASGYATATVAVLAFGTTTWVISSAQIWPHGPGQLTMALALLALAASNYVGAGLAFAAALLIRPVSAVMAAAAGILESIRLRSPKPVLMIGLPTFAALVILMGYNRLVFGVWALRGGYSSSVAGDAVNRFDVGAYLNNLFEMFLGFPNGLFLWSPVVAVCLAGVWFARRSLPGWAVSAAWAALAYLLVHAFLNRASGGLSMFYRYPLEPLILAVPALTLGARRLFEGGRTARMVLLVAVALSIGFQLFAVFGYTCTNFSPDALACQIR